MPETVNRILRNGATSYLTMAVTSACGFVMIPIALRYLEKEDYGLLVLVGALASYVSLSGLGISSAILRSVAAARNSTSLSDLNTTISTAFFFYLVISIVGLVATLPLIYPLPRFFQVPQDKVGLSQMLLLISFAGAWAALPLSVYTGVLAGRERFDLTNLVQASQAITWLATGLLVLWSGGRLVAFLAARTALSLFFALAGAWLARRELPSLSVSVRRVRLSELKHLLSFGLFIFFVHVAVQITNQADAIVIGMFLPLGAIAVYNIGFRLSEIAREIPAQLGRLLPPVIARLDRRTQSDQLRTALEESTKWILVVALAATTPLFAFAHFLIRAWVGEEFNQAVLVTKILCIGGVVSIGQTPAGYILMFKGRHKLLAGLAVAECVTNLVLSIVLIRRFGILGVALGTVVPVFIVNALVNVPLACRLVDMPVSRFLRRAVLPALAPAIVTFGIAVAVERLVWLDHVLPTIFAMVATAAAYTILYVTVFLSSEDRGRYFLYMRDAVRQALFASSNRRPGTRSQAT